MYTLSVQLQSSPFSPLSSPPPYPLHNLFTQHFLKGKILGIISGCQGLQGREGIDYNVIKTLKFSLTRISAKLYILSSPLPGEVYACTCECRGGCLQQRPANSSRKVLNVLTGIMEGKAVTNITITTHERVNRIIPQP